MLLSVTDRRAIEQAYRYGAGDAGPADFESDCAGADAWVGDCAAYPADVWGGSAGGAGGALSVAAQAGAERLDHGEVEGQRQQPAGEVLHIDSGWAESFGDG